MMYGCKVVGIAYSTTGGMCELGLESGRGTRTAPHPLSISVWG